MAQVRERSLLNEGDVEISERTYNLVIGGVLLYGFLVNCFMVAFLSDAAFNFVYNNTLMFYISYFVMCIAGGLMVHRSSNPVISFIGYNFYVIPLGLIISASLQLLSYAGATDIVVTAFGITAIVTIAMMVASTLFPSFFLSMGRTLFVTLAITVILELILALAGASLGIIDYVVVLIFCGYIGYDWARANTMVRTLDNAIDSAAELYVDIVVLFMRLLRILARSSND
ncbi:MAG: Bax inhibitor-1 family protein [Clostridium sp.]|nr:Bax inhibitor-1 family protein [Clostridium sp.]MCM1209577.1 Bax inhibitor-1 family protein [Ruminococcus sp.]